VLNTASTTQCLAHSNFNTVNELALRTHQLNTFFQHSVSRCVRKQGLLDLSAIEMRIPNGLDNEHNRVLVLQD
jgi:hypothetical protein